MGLISSLPQSQFLQCHHAASIHRLQLPAWALAKTGSMAGCCTSPVLKVWLATELFSVTGSSGCSHSIWGCAIINKRKQRNAEETWNKSRGHTFLLTTILLFLRSAFSLLSLHLSCGYINSTLTHWELAVTQQQTTLEWAISALPLTCHGFLGQCTPFFQLGRSGLM